MVREGWHDAGQAFGTATINGGALPEKKSPIAPGYYADIVAVDGDPLADIDVAINKVKWVMKGGTVVADKR